MRQIPFKIVEGCERCDNMLKGLDNLANSRNINDVEVILRRESQTVGWHISKLKVDGYEMELQGRDRKMPWVKCAKCKMEYHTDNRYIGMPEDRKHICPDCGSNQLHANDPFVKLDELLFS